MEPYDKAKTSAISILSFGLMFFGVAFISPEVKWLFVGLFTATGMALLPWGLTSKRFDVFNRYRIAAILAPMFFATVPASVPVWGEILIAIGSIALIAFAKPTVSVMWIGLPLMGMVLPIYGFSVFSSALLIMSFLIVIMPQAELARTWWHVFHSLVIGASYLAFVS